MSKTESKAMSLGDHMRRFDGEVDRLAEVAHRIDEELIRIEFNKPLRDRERPCRWPGAYISGYPRTRFQPNMGELKAGASSEWHAAWLGEVEERFDQSPLLRPLVQQYAERLACIETVLNMGLQPVKSNSEVRDEPPFVAQLTQPPAGNFKRPKSDDWHATPAPSKWTVEPLSASDAGPLAFKSLAELDREHSIDGGEHRPHLKSGDSACSFCAGINGVHSDRCNDLRSDEMPRSRHPLDNPRDDAEDEQDAADGDD
jgi:hypothetical protein